MAECGLKKKTQKIRNPKSAIRNNQADAFSAQCPCFRATSLLFRRKGNRKSDGGQESSWLPLILPPKPWLVGVQGGGIRIIRLGGFQLF